MDRKKPLAYRLGLAFRPPPYWTETAISQHIKKSRSYLLATSALKYQFIQDHRSQFGVREMCAVLQVSRSGYYAWLTRPPSDHAQQDQLLLEAIRTSYQGSGGSYGSPRVYRDLQDLGVRCSLKRVARLMQQHHLRAHTPRRFVVTTQSKHSWPIAHNHLNRAYQVEHVADVNRAWAGDITYIPTAQGWLYLAVVLDLKSRKVIGWSMASSLEQTLVHEALKMALGRRGIEHAEGELLFHSDWGSQYAANDYQEQLSHHGIVCSMSRKANCWDNAPVESFFATLKKELIHRERYLTHAYARLSMFHYIEAFYNRQRRHSALGYLSPHDYEQLLLN